MTLASVNKLFTTAAALKILGVDYRYETLLWLRGEVGDDGVARGDLVVKGSGDPNISGRFYSTPTTLFDVWAQAVRKRGVRRIEGRLLGDDSLFDREWVHPAWPKDQLMNWYCAPVGALSFNDNCIDVTVRAGDAVGAPLAVASTPATQYATFRVEGRTGPRGTRPMIWFRWNTASQGITVGGKYPLNSSPLTESVPVPHPTLYFLTVFREALIRAGIEVSGPCGVTDGPVAVPADSTTLIVRHISGLLDTVRIANKRSQNYYVEQMLKTLGARRTGVGTFESGRAAVQDFLAGIGIPSGTYEMVDGSGLSRANSFTPSQVVHLLRWVYGSELRDAFASTLACGGVDGTLTKRFSRPPLKGRVFAKTGYIQGVFALAGFVRSPRNRVYAFTILVNGFGGGGNQVKQLQESICLRILEWESAWAGDIARSPSPAP